MIAEAKVEKGLTQRSRIVMSIRDDIYLYKPTVFNVVIVHVVRIVSHCARMTESSLIVQG